MAKKKQQKKDKKDNSDLLATEEIIKRASEAYTDELLPARKEKEEEASAIFEEIIDSEKAFLDFFNEERLNISIIFKGKLFKFKVKPIEPDDDLDILDMDMSIYADFTETEKRLIKKATSGEKLTAKEERLAEKLDKRVKDVTSRKILERSEAILVQHVTPPSFKSEKKRLEFWRSVELNFKIFVAEQVMKALGLDANAQIQLFRPS